MIHAPDRPLTPPDPTRLPRHMADGEATVVICGGSRDGEEALVEYIERVGGELEIVSAIATEDGIDLLPFVTERTVEKLREELEGTASAEREYYEDCRA